MSRYIVFDDRGIIHESSSEDDAFKEFEDTQEFDGDIIFAEILGRRR